MTKINLNQKLIFDLNGAINDAKIKTEKRLTQQKLAKECSVSTMTVIQWSLKEEKPLRIVYALISAYGLDVEQIVNIEDHNMLKVVLHLMKKYELELNQIIKLIN